MPQKKKEIRKITLGILRGYSGVSWHMFNFRMSVFSGKTEKSIAKFRDKQTTERTKLLKKYQHLSLKSLNKKMFALYKKQEKDLIRFLNK